MKKNLKLIALATLVAPVLASCGNNNTTSYVETRTEQEIIEELAESALLEVGLTYAKFASDGIPYGETSLTMTNNQKVWDGDQVGLNFSFTYTISPQESYETPFLTLSDKEGVATLTADLVTLLDLQGYPESTLMGAAMYNLKAEVTFVGYGENFKAPKGLKITSNFIGEKISENSWNALIKVTQSGKLSEVKSAKNKDMVLTIGRITGAYDWSYDEIFRGVWITDGADGLMLYAGTLQTDFYDSEDSEAKLKVGDVVQVFGEASPYNGLFEVKPKKVIKVTDQTVIDSIAPASYPTITGAELAAKTIVDTGNIVRISGLKLGKLDGTPVDLSSLATGSHWTLNCNDGTTDITVYVNYHVGATAQTAVKTFLQVLTGSQTFSLLSSVSAYNAIQLTPICVGNLSVADCFTLD